MRHLFGLGEFLRSIDLTDTRSYDEIVESRRRADQGRAAQAVGSIGRGWDQNKWGDTRFPTHEALSRISPNNPVVLERIDGHAMLANAAAMHAAGVTAATKDPAGGRIERGANGEPDRRVRRQRAWLSSIASCRRSRTTRCAAPRSPRSPSRTATASPACTTPASRATCSTSSRSSRRPATFSLRVYAMIADDSAAIEHYFQRGPQSALYDGHLWIRSIKLYADGALGSRGAALLDPYTDDPKNIGLLKSTPEHLRDVSTRALQHGFQVATHAIGDRGNRVALDAYEAALKAVPTADHRFRIEHVQILDHADIPRFAQLGVIPSMQAVHQTSDMYWAPTRLGYARTFGAYAWRSLLNTGVIIPERQRLSRWSA